MHFHKGKHEKLNKLLYNCVYRFLGKSLSTYSWIIKKVNTLIFQCRPHFSAVAKCDMLAPLRLYEWWASIVEWGLILTYLTLQGKGGDWEYFKKLVLPLSSNWQTRTFQFIWLINKMTLQIQYQITRGFRINSGQKETFT